METDKIIVNREELINLLNSDGMIFKVVNIRSVGEDKFEITYEL